RFPQRAHNRSRADRAKDAGLKGAGGTQDRADLPATRTVDDNTVAAVQGERLPGGKTAQSAALAMSDKVMPSRITGSRRASRRRRRDSYINRASDHVKPSVSRMI